MIDVLATSTVDSGILAWTEAIEDPRPALQSIRVLIRADIAERFDSETDPWGASWMATSITTLEIRLARGQSPQARRFTPSSRSTDGGRGIAIGFGSNPHARRFHFGNPANRVFGRGHGPIPPRPILPLRGDALDMPDALRAEIMEAFQDEIREAVRQRR